jgi:hypothetical protein
MRLAYGLDPPYRREEREDIMELQILITCENAAFAENSEYECARILRRCAEKIESEGLQEMDRMPLMDINGNRVGIISYE